MGNYTRVPNFPLKNIVEITPDDETVYDPPLICVRIGDVTGGTTLEAVNLAGNALTIENCVQAEVIWGPFIKIVGTGTDVGSIVGWTNE